jgi:hypothetical protein
VSRNTVQLAVFTYLNFEMIQEAGYGFNYSWVDQDAGSHYFSPKAGALFVITKLGADFQRHLPETDLHSDERISEAAQRLYTETFGRAVAAPGRIRSLNVFDSPVRNRDERVLAFPHWTFVEFNKLRNVLGGPDQLGLTLVTSREFVQSWKQGAEDATKWDGVSRFGGRTAGTTRQYSRVKLLTTDMPGGRILAEDHDDMVFFAWRALRHGFEESIDPFQFFRERPLGPEFRISDLHELYEVCRGEIIQRDYFRRLVLSKESFIREIGMSMKASQSSIPRQGKPASFYSPRYFQEL